MIELTKLNKKKFILNCELIETVESTPDTVITLRNGKLCIVEESPEQIIELAMAYKRAVYINTISGPPEVKKRQEAQEDSDI